MQTLDAPILDAVILRVSIKLTLLPSNRVKYALFGTSALGATSARTTNLGHLKSRRKQWRLQASRKENIHEAIEFTFFSLSLETASMFSHNTTHAQRSSSYRNNRCVDRRYLEAKASVNQLHGWKSSAVFRQTCAFVNRHQQRPKR